MCQQFSCKLNLKQNLKLRWFSPPIGLHTRSQAFAPAGRYRGRRDLTPDDLRAPRIAMKAIREGLYDQGRPYDSSSFARKTGPVHLDAQKTTRQIRQGSADAYSEWVLCPRAGDCRDLRKACAGVRRTIRAIGVLNQPAIPHDPLQQPDDGQADGVLHA